MTGSRDYIRDGAEIYRRSFAIIRAEADLARFTPAEERIAVRIIHACGMPEIVSDHVVDRFDTLQKIMRAGIAELTEVEGVGDARARAIKEGLSRLAETSILERYV
mgnify:CR=1 FL=1